MWETVRSETTIPEDRIKKAKNTTAMSQFMHKLGET